MLQFVIIWFDIISGFIYNIIIITYNKIKRLKQNNIKG